MMISEGYLPRPNKTVHNRGKDLRHCRFQLEGREFLRALHSPFPDPHDADLGVAFLAPDAENVLVPGVG